MSNNFAMSLQKRGVVSINADSVGLGLTLVYRHNLAKPSNLKESGVPDTLGAYVLCEQTPGSDGQWNLYVGKSAEGGLPSRLQTHMSSPKSHIAGWSAAVLLHSKDGDSLSQDACSALEHCLWELLGEKNGIALANEKPPTGDPRLQWSQVDKTRQACETAVDFLPLIGVGVGFPAKTVKTPAPAVREKNKKSPVGDKKKRTPVFSPTKVADLIDAGTLSVGDVLVPSSEAHTRRGVAIIYNAKGDIQITTLHRRRVEHENLIFNSLSTASEPLMAPASRANGWTFWKSQKLNRDLASLRKDHDAKRTANS